MFFVRGSFFSSRVAVHPSTPGIPRSITTTSGTSSCAFAIASALAVLALVTLVLKTFLEWRYGDELARSARH